MTTVTLVNINMGGTDPHPAPLGVLHLAAYLEARGTAVEVLNYRQALGDGPVEAFDAFLDSCGDVVGISAMSSAMPFLLAWFPSFRLRFPDRRLVLGGFGPTADPERVLQDFPAVTAVVSGWGEQPLHGIVTALERGHDLRNIPGVTCHDDHGVSTTPPDPVLPDIDTFPRPAHHLVGFGDSGTSIPVVTARGCPSRCAFCDIPGSLPRGFAVRSVGNVLDEIEDLLALRADDLTCRDGKAANGVRRDPVTIGIVDDTFCLDRERVVRFCNGIRDRGLRFQWRVSARVDQVDERLLDCMAGAGCTSVYFGIESGSDRVLRAVRKGFDASTALEAVRAATNTIETVTTSFVWGLPPESSADFMESVVLMALCREAGAGVQAHLWSPLPRSALYADAADALQLSPHFVSDIAGSGSRRCAERFEPVIRRYPRLCAPFYHYPHPDLAERERVLQNLRFATSP